MGTLLDLKTRIITETNRDDLGDDLASTLSGIIAKSIDQYAAERWWFNELRTTSACTNGNQYATLPTGFRVLDKLFLVVGNVNYTLRPRQNLEIEALYTTPISGQPTDYSVIGSQVRFWPTPNSAYPLIWELIADVTPALDYADDTSANAWTNQGQDLICSEAKMRLYRDVLSAQTTDPRYQLALQQREQAYSRLKGETTRRLSTGRVRASW